MELILQSPTVFRRYTILCLKKFRRCLFVHLSFLRFFAVASCICLHLKFEWHMVHIVEPGDKMDLAVLALSVCQCS